MNKTKILFMLILCMAFLTGCGDVGQKKHLKPPAEITSADVDYSITVEEDVFGRVEIIDTYTLDGEKYFTFTTTLPHDNKERTLSATEYDKTIGLGNDAFTTDICRYEGKAEVKNCLALVRPVPTLFICNTYIDQRKLPVIGDLDDSDGIEHELWLWKEKYAIFDGEFTKNEIEELNQEFSLMYNDIKNSNRLDCPGYELEWSAYSGFNFSSFEKFLADYSIDIKENWWDEDKNKEK